MVSDQSRRDEEEARREAVPIVLLVAALQLLLAGVGVARGWQLWIAPGWVWAIPAILELAVMAVLVVSRPGRLPLQHGRRRTLALWLLGVIVAANVAALAALVVSLALAQERSGVRLLFEASTVWGTNVLAFGLAFWELDRGGPVRRLQPGAPPADFQFPQLENPELAEPGWRPQLVDYVYVSFTNAIAFSPTDAMPLTRRAKLLMLLESAFSAAAVLFLAARAVNILR